MNRSSLLRIGALLAAVGVCSAAEKEILRDIRAFFETQDAAKRQALAARIEQDPQYRPEKVADWLHAAGLFEPLKPGERTLSAAVDEGGAVEIVLRIPKDYDADKPWPLIYALHGSGGDGKQMVAYLEHVLGDDVEQFVIAAPSRYHRTRRGEGEMTPIHSLLLDAIRRHVHADAARMYAFGYSMGGFACWSLAVASPEQFAAIAPVAGALATPDELLDDLLLPNLAQTPVFAVWGGRDTAGASGAPEPNGGIAGRNRRVLAKARELGLPVNGYEDADAGHSNVTPPKEFLLKAFSQRRPTFPQRSSKVVIDVYHTFGPWIEGDQWRGSRLAQGEHIELRLERGEDPTNPEDVRAATRRAMEARLARLSAEFDGPNVVVEAKKLKEATVWFNLETAQFDEPVRLKVGRRTVFNDKLTPSLLVCLTQASRTHDFDRLRWAGLRFTAPKTVTVVNGETVFRPLKDRDETNE